MRQSTQTNISKSDQTNKIKKQRCRFTPREDRILKKIVNDQSDFSWEEIAQMLPGRTSRQCWDRYNNYLSKQISNAKWTDEEDELILKMYTKIGPKWTLIAKSLKGRSANNVKNRWHKTLSKRYGKTEKEKPLTVVDIDYIIAKDNTFLSKFGEENEYTLFRELLS